VSEELIYKNLHRPSENIEVGIFYLKKLLHNFRFNYQLATIAYNMGPNKLRNLLVVDKIDTANFSYLLKVKESYNDLVRNFNLELRKRPFPYENTYVVRGQGRILEEQFLKFYTMTFPSLKADILIGSENLFNISSHSLPF
jgi:soluble lytic murein transglycosylase